MSNQKILCYSNFKFVPQTHFVSFVAVIANLDDFHRSHIMKGKNPVSFSLFRNVAYEMITNTILFKSGYVHLTFYNDSVFVFIDDRDDNSRSILVRVYDFTNIH